RHTRFSRDWSSDVCSSDLSIRITYAKALLVDQVLLKKAQQEHDVTLCQEILQEAYLTDVRPLVRQARLQSNAPLDPLKSYRNLGVREQLIKERGKNTVATGL